MNNKESICAVVVTYNRKELLIECLEALLKQTREVNGIYLIDNASTDGTPELLEEKGLIQELPQKDLKEPWEREFKIKNNKGDEIPLYYVRMNENTGGAGGFYEGLKRAYERGYDWYWLMDDDGLPDKNCLKSLLKYKDKGDFLAPLVIDINKKDELSFSIKDYENNTIIKKTSEITKKIYYKTANPFNGVLLSNKMVQKIGFPKKEMFIWGDEVEYQFRAMKEKFIVLTITEAIHYHPKGRVQQKKILNSLYINWQNVKLKNYCDIRNKSYIIKKYYKHKYLSIIYFSFKYFLAFLLKKISLQELFFVYSSINDGWQEKWNKEKFFLKK